MKIKIFLVDNRRRRLFYMVYQEGWTKHRVVCLTARGGGNDVVKDCGTLSDDKKAPVES